MAQTWTDLPLDRPIYIAGVTPDALTLLIDPLPLDAPAIITYRVAPRKRPARIVGDLIDQLDRIACELFPAWLPTASSIDSAVGAGAVAVRSIALHVALDSDQHGAFLADLAERALSPQMKETPSFSPEVRSIGLSRVIAAGFRRPRTAIMLQVPAGLDSESEQALVVAARWMTDCGGCGTWFIGPGLRSVDSVEAIAFIPPGLNELLSSESTEAGGASGPDVIGYPAIAGRPHPRSSAEQLLETALQGAHWADGREWNQVLQSNTLTNPVKVDLIWRRERCIVEIDGADHCQPIQFAADRQRDVLLQLAGYAVLRFTNQQVIWHRDLVLTQIERFLTKRRSNIL